MLNVGLYTGNWQQACIPTAPRVNSQFCCGDSPDAREWNDFRLCLEKNNLTWDFVKWMPKKKVNVYRIVRKWKM